MRARCAVVWPTGPAGEKEHFDGWYPLLASLTKPQRLFSSNARLALLPQVAEELREVALFGHEASFDLEAMVQACIGADWE